ncbi:hypothetical protein [Enterococcus sp. OL5]|uniref:hypothetical protein n=1 Tax=Enterococcus sp. OL5 TaxID=2590214 RepID=UPI00112BA4C0|nr:hypothetical protein [Enterococcus sp. OL5]TPR58266.1 hypothetical protein FJU10_04280 [Enterococcus sp. OL5]
MREFFSVMIIFFCVSLYTPIWLSMFSYFEERRKRRKEGDTYRYFRMAFNVVVMLVSIFIPVFILLLVPKPSQEGNSLQKLVKVDLATQFIIQYIGGLLVSYLLIFFLISFLQRKLTAKKFNRSFY